MRVSGALPALLLATVAACSGQSEQDVQKAASSDAPVTPGQPEARVASAGAPGKGSGLTGQVSPLTSAISGLNVRVTDFGTIIDLPADALFEFDRADLTSGAAEQLQKSAQVIRGAPAGSIRIVGHTDSKGDDAYNLKLSQDRARTVADWFSQQVGVRQRTFEVTGMGEKEPIVPNETATGQDDPAGRAKNRRVEVILPK